MATNGDSLDKTLRNEAKHLLSAGLHDLLATYGTVHVYGSYALGLMTWRDLDVHVVRASMNRDEFFALGGQLLTLLNPHRMHFRDETSVRTAGLPAGFYWGIHLTNEPFGPWKIDVWAVTPAIDEHTRQRMAALRERLSEDARKHILAIKAAVHAHPQYRRSFTSSDVYEAVLEHGVVDLPDFWHYLANRGIATPSLPPQTGSQ